ncbi:hypothetical protein ACFYP7_31325 [Micromonospora arida]|uniref:hypothetical protein n=1 Tax=Micromonospora arida TaxID=2203715 RepID=UPI00367F785C
MSILPPPPIAVPACGILAVGAEGDPRVTELTDATRAVAAAAPPAAPEDLSGIAMDFEHHLRHCPSIRQVNLSGRFGTQGDYVGR